MVPVPDTAMVLAAGLGKRMRPLTATRPKPMVEVAGAPLIEHAFARLRGAGVKRAVVNVHYLADSFEAYLKNRVSGLEITVSDERGALLETGGGVRKALPLIGADPFYVLNSDQVWLNGPVDSLKLLAMQWDATRMDALLLLVPYARAHAHGGRGDFHMDPFGRLTRRRPGRVAPFVYAGAWLSSRRLFDDAPHGAFSLNLLWDRAIAAGRLFGVTHSGLWVDVGTPDAVAEAEARLAGAA